MNFEEYLQDKLLQIDNLQDRVVMREIFESVLVPLNRYCDHRFAILENKVLNEAENMSKYDIYTGIIQRDRYDATMTDLLPILTYLEVFHDQYAIKETQVGTYRSIDGTNQQELLITIQNDYPVPKRVSYQYREFYLIMKDEITTLRVPVYSGELHFFHSDYKDYYYLPQEDMAIHKSVAGYVDKGYREKAKISNCYTRKTGDFLPQYSTVMQPEFRKEYKDKVSYFEITEDFYSSDIMLRRYVDHILKLMLNAKK